MSSTSKAVVNHLPHLYSRYCPCYCSPVFYLSIVLIESYPTLVLFSTDNGSCNFQNRVRARLEDSFLRWKFSLLRFSADNYFCISDFLLSNNPCIGPRLIINQVYEHELPDQRSCPG